MVMIFSVVSGFTVCIVEASRSVDSVSVDRVSRKMFRIDVVSNCLRMLNIFGR